MTIRFLLVRCVAAGVLVTLLPRTTRSQLIARVSGVVRDSASGQPAHRTHVCVMVGPPVRALRCARSDSIGAYHVDSLPAGVQLISVQCEVLQGFSKQLTYDSVALTASGPTRRDWTVQTAGCDPRPVRSVTGVFRGHFTRGIESSAFVPCSADGWFIPSDSLGPKSVDRRRAWHVGDVGGGSATGAQVAGSSSR
jgi:hypothetical protein